MLRRFRSILATVLAMTMAASSAGCTFIGLGIGASTDRMDYSQRQPPAGTEVSLELMDGRTVDGKLVFAHSDAIAVGNEVVPRMQVRTMRERVGSNALAGLFIGILLDAAIVLGTVMVFSGISYD